MRLTVLRRNGYSWSGLSRCHPVKSFWRLVYAFQPLLNGMIATLDPGARGECPAGRSIRALQARKGCSMLDFWPGRTETLHPFSEQTAYPGRKRRGPPGDSQPGTGDRASRPGPRSGPRAGQQWAAAGGCLPRNLLAETPGRCSSISCNSLLISYVNHAIIATKHATNHCYCRIPHQLPIINHQ